MTVIRLLVVATINELSAYLGTSPDPNTALKFMKLNPLGSKFGGNRNRLCGG
jgi:hypothetical protein